MGYSCLLCPWLVTKCAGEKKRHMESHTKLSPIVRNIDIACVKTAGPQNAKVIVMGLLGQERWALQQMGTVGQRLRAWGQLMGAFG